MAKFKLLYINWPA